MKVCFTSQLASLPATLSKSSYKSFLSIAFAPLLLAGLCAPSYAQTSTTTTTLAATAAGSPATSIATLTPVTLTATVTSSGTPVIHGLVNFCEATATYCTDIHLLGTATLTSNGTAVYRFVPGPGAHSYKAVFRATKLYASSSSAALSLTASGRLLSATSMALAGTRGDYTLTARVAGAAAQAPTGSISFDDQTENLSLGVVSLTANTAGFTFSFAAPAGVPTTFGFAVADLNGDGIPDEVIGYSSSYGLDDPPCREVGSPVDPNYNVAVFLGNGDGTFTAAPGPSLETLCTPDSVSIADVNSDGFPDLLVSSNNGPSRLFLGNGTGNFSISSADTPSGTPLVLDVNGDGFLDIVDFGGGLSFALGDGNGNFSHQASAISNLFPFFAAAGDFNGDGIPDMAAVLPGSSSPPPGPSIQILLGVGDGTFVASPTPLALSATYICVSDVNNDGKADLIVFDGALTVTILTGDGTGNFNTTSSFPLAPNPNAIPYGISVADFNKDGIPDIAAVPADVNSITGLPAAKIYLGDGTGAFTAQPVTYAGIPAGSELELQHTTFQPIFSINDINSDGIPDLVNANGAFFIGTQSATATISSIPISTAGSGSHLLLARYLNGDPNYLQSASALAAIQSAQATPTVTVATSPNPANAGQSLTLRVTVTGPGDVPTGTVNLFNGLTPLGTTTLTNGAAELIITAPAAGSHSITASYLGDGNYAAATSPALNLTTVNAVSTTITLAVTSGGNPVTTIPSNQPVTLTATLTAGGSPVTTGTVNFCIATQTSCYGAALVGTAQLTAAGTANITIRPPQGTHVYKANYQGASGIITSSSPVQDLTVNKPAAPQLPTQSSITSTGTTGNYTLNATVIGNGNEPLSGNLNFIDLTHGNSILATESLTAPVTSTGFMFVPTQTNPQTGTPLARADFNGDGILDLVTQVSGGVALQLGNGDLTFKTGTVLPGNGPVAIGDFNSDGKLDLAITVTGGVQIYLGDGTGKLTALPLGPALTVGPFAMSTADFNRDGILDLVVQDVPTTHVFFGAGDGTFQVGPTFDVTGGIIADFGPDVTSMVTGDFNSDGIPDIAVAWYAGFGNSTSKFPVTFLFSDGSGNFTQTEVDPNLDAGGPSGTSSVIGANPNPTHLATLDLNHDGRQDVVAAWGFVACCPETQNFGTINLINNGDGTITASGLTGGPDGGAQGPPTAISVLDLTGDGSDTIALELGEGTYNSYTGEPAQPPVISFNANAPAFILPDSFSGGFVPGDYDGDGIDEIAVRTNSAMSIVGYQVTATASATKIAVVPAGTGTHQVDASYAGDPVHKGSASTSVGLDSGIGAPTIQLSASPTAAYGSAVVITATLTSTGPTPTGVVTFLNGSASIGTGTLTNGVATLSISTLPLGKNSITATYPGDAGNSATTSSAITITVSQAVATLTLTASPSAPVYGATVTLTAKLGGVTTIPTGNITFKSQIGSLGTQPLDKTGTATLTLSSLAAGSYSITATFAGDTDDTAVTSKAVVVPVAPAIIATSALSTIYSGQADTITITLGVGTSATVPTGTITLTNGSFTSAATALSAGSASITIPANTLANGNDAITVTYSGDTTYPASTGQVTVAVSSAPAPGFTISAPAVTVMPGGTTGNTVTVTLTPVTGFTGSVALSAQLTASPTGVTDPPALSFGSASTVAINGSSAVTATLTVSTSAPVTSQNNPQSAPGRRGFASAGGAILACILVIGLPRRMRQTRRRLHQLLRQSRSRWIVLLLAFALISAGLSSCGGGGKKIVDPGTTPGSYTITVTGTSGSVTSTGTVALTVQ